MGQQRTNLVGAVVLVIRLAVLALQAGPDLSTDADPVAYFDFGDFIADLDGFADDFVADAKREARFTPSTCSCLSHGQCRLRMVKMVVPVMVWTSDPQTPQASILMSMSRSSNFFGLICHTDRHQWILRSERPIEY